MPGFHPHVPHILWIEYEEDWDDRLCQRWVTIKDETITYLTVIPGELF